MVRSNLVLYVDVRDPSASLFACGLGLGLWMFEVERLLVVRTSQSTYFVSDYYYCYRERNTLRVLQPTTGMLCLLDVVQLLHLKAFPVRYPLF